MFKISNIVNDYEEREDFALHFAKELAAIENENGEFPEIIECAKCEINSVVCIDEQGVCTVCREDFDVYLCPSCDTYCHEDEFEDYEVCIGCLEQAQYGSYED